MKKDRRLQIFITERQYELLARKKEETGATIGEIVRRCINAVLEDQDAK